MNLSLPSLPDETVKNLRARAYTRTELLKLHRAAVNRHRELQRGFRRACQITAGAIFLTFLLSLPFHSPLLLWSVGAAAGMAVLILAAVKYAAADRIRRQFCRGLRAGYPEWEEELGAESFFTWHSKGDVPAPETAGSFDIGEPLTSLCRQEVQEPFLFSIEEVFELREEPGLVAAGIVQGTVRKGMTAYVVFPRYKTARKTTVREIEVPKKNGSAWKAASASDCHAALLLSGFAHPSQELKQELKRAVVTNDLNRFF